ncbi:MAG: hypothetical protein L6Q29_04375 [Candidatus Pacebacteria bacterium]|nr:hypothetical protein [Candidatus Paceibacterota bacterium]NUQ57587.1 hypothetical protein [Candidatus Paceibacter sp.]
MFTDEVKNVLLKNRLIVVGEIHGAKENIFFIKKILSFYNKNDIPITLAMEWPSELTEEINRYIFKKGKLNWLSWKFSESPDGRISKEHLDLIKWLRAKNIKLVCFSVGGLSWNERDKKMAENILAEYNQNKEVKILVCAGRLHSRSKDFDFGKEKYTPLGYYLPKNETIFFELDYLSGNYFNVGLKKIRSKKINVKKDISIIKNKNNIFKVIIKKATPVHILSDKYLPKK